MEKLNNDFDTLANILGSNHYEKFIQMKIDDLRFSFFEAADELLVEGVEVSRQARWELLKKVTELSLKTMEELNAQFFQKTGSKFTFSMLFSDFNSKLFQRLTFLTRPRF
jgi:predicted DNA-binding protein YlxM (UPF0122 family)